MPYPVTKHRADGSKEVTIRDERKVLALVVLLKQPGNTQRRPRARMTPQYSALCTDCKVPMTEVKMWELPSNLNPVHDSTEGRRKYKQGHE